jgi:arabinose-5-phosphate isomerase
MQEKKVKTPEEILELARRTIAHESEAIYRLQSWLTEDFAAAVELILSSKGRVIVTGIGKSANIAQKITATLNSTGTPAIFMHAADAIHGDLGIIQPDDVVICLSKSGSTPEIKVLLPLIRMQGNRIIAICGNTESFLARNADYVLNATVEKEACPNNLAPTSSTTAQMVLGDALAVALLECRGFTTADFARFHPGGSLGKKLYLRVGDLSGNNEHPAVEAGDDIRKVIVEISSKRLGATAVLDNGKLLGIITDGDLRRMLLGEQNPDRLKAADIMTPNPKMLEEDTQAVEALQLMRQYKITQLIVTRQGEYAGIIHMHDILREGII